MNSSEDDMDDVFNMAKHMHWITSVYIGIIFIVIGLTGNVISLCVWSRKSMRSSTGVYLIAQAIADSGLLVFFFLVDSLAMIFPVIKKSYHYAVFYSYIGYPIYFFFIITSIWLLVGVTVDRYIQVCWVAKAKTMCNPKRSALGIITISSLCFLINIPHFFSYYADGNALQSEDAIVVSGFGSGEGGMDYDFYVHCIFLVLAPWFSIFVFNMLIIRRVTKVNRKMHDKRGSVGKMAAKRSENQITRLLLTVTFAFLILVAFQCITQCFFMLKPNYADFRIVDQAFSVAKLGVVINSSINFFLYCLSGQKFRKELINLIKHKICSKEELPPRTPSSVDSGHSSGASTDLSVSSRL